MGTKCKQVLSARIVGYPSNLEVPRSFSELMRTLTILSLALLMSCTSAPSVQEVVDQAINVSKVEKLKNAEASFTFRGIDYAYKFRNGNYRYTRIQRDTLGNTLKDVLVNTGLNRFLNDSLVVLEEERRTAYSASVNSVIYFAFLPLSLNDAAVNKTYAGTEQIKNRTYHKVKVTFDEEGGGEDFDDVFYYWFDAEDYSMDYLAYSYAEKDGTGMRFREAYNQRSVNEVAIQDYRNFKPKVKGSLPLEELGQAFNDGTLELLSVIELEDVSISL